MNNRIASHFKGVLTGLAVFFFACVVDTAAQDSFKDFKQQYQQGYQQYLDSFENGIAKSQQDYENYQEAYKKEFEAFKKEMLQKWGDFKERSKKQWVEYKENGNLRISTDFEDGNVQVEVLADSKEAAEQVKEKMPEKVEKAMKSKGTREGFETEKLPNKEVTKEPVLNDQLQKSEEESVGQYAKEVAEQKTKTKKVKGEDGKSRYVVYVDFDLASDHLQKRARKVEDQVYNYAQKNNLDPSLVFAVIHVESYYNPTAASHANAYGLMQLVPTTGGRDAYRKIYNEDGIPTKEYLFDPANNIEMGCTFIDILGERYFKSVKNETTRLYMIISAYNTGAGNVAVAYTGDTGLRRAIQEANSMSAEENYEHLRENLEYAEARNYLKKVTTQREKYDRWKRETSQ